MSTVIILSLGHNHYAIPAKSGAAGKLLEMLQEAVSVRRSHLMAPSFREVYYLEARPTNVSISVVQGDQVLAPEREDLSHHDAIDIQALPGAKKLLRLKR